VRWLMQTPAVSGLFNVGTGTARSFRDLISALFRALGHEPQIEYIDMPENIRDQYQYFTEAELGSLRQAGYNAGFMPLEDSVRQYVTRYLDTADRYR
jgi:ADP-L-glycero-D-manno-heptose 6-epimerase